MPLPDGRISLIIAGSRPPETIRHNQLALDKWYRRREQSKLIWRAFQASPWRFFEVGEVISGMAAGVDTLGYRWAKGEGVATVQMPALWTGKDGEVDKRAGFKRNEQMGLKGDGLLAVWDGESKGTAHMIEVMEMLGKDVFVFDME